MCHSGRWFLTSLILLGAAFAGEVSTSAGTVTFGTPFDASLSPPYGTQGLISQFNPSLGQLNEVDLTATMSGFASFNFENNSPNRIVFNATESLTIHAWIGNDPGTGYTFSAEVYTQNVSVSAMPGLNAAGFVTPQSLQTVSLTTGLSPFIGPEGFLDVGASILSANFAADNPSIVYVGGPGAASGGGTMTATYIYSDPASVPAPPSVVLAGTSALICFGWWWHRRRLAT